MRWRSVFEITVVFLVISLIVAFHIEPLGADSSSNIDVYTQKGGEGSNQPSGIFQPLEIVQATAYLTSDVIVPCYVPTAFEIRGPKNAYHNITFLLSNFTSSENLTQITFRIPWMWYDDQRNPISPEQGEESILGTWKITAKVWIIDQHVSDTVTFNVDWHQDVASVVPHEQSQSGIALTGDVDSDQDVDPIDVFSYLAPAYGTNIGDPVYNFKCDFDDDEDVDRVDVFSYMAPNYGKTVG